VAMAGGQVAVSSADLLAFQRAQAIRDAFFPGPAGLRFELLPLGLDASAKSATLEADGIKTDLQAAAGRPILLGWPARGNVTLSFDPPSGAGPLALDGAWSTLRLAMGPDAVLQPDGRATDRFRLTLRQGEHWAQFLLHAGGSANPFALAELHQFRCPVLAP
jgi:type VI secretion system protein ImpL